MLSTTIDVAEARLYGLLDAAMVMGIRFMVPAPSFYRGLESGIEEREQKLTSSFLREKSSLILQYWVVIFRVIGASVKG